ncbi:carboxypeptidase-like regulatory domain-containing protein [Flavobacterium sp. J372]|uniref:carboxypeptidase-like regulatory domain-containing protein n=1 Tax=Flavobacterium sp. J372 TaxID=2898436 RepID=UPI0021514BEA|nr:carboxypeptidase-like regulatory domain-containing protein [Flavobacterium sp. J372]MCR5862215.1 carboxypeptidase-like regulatory domain-containing protein [Flavobacterium sp. J372]
MKQLFACLFVIFSINFATAQSLLKGIIKDKSDKPVSHVTVSTEDGRHVTLTNDAGAFTLTYPSDTRQIVLEHIGYSPLFISVTQLPKDGVFYMEQEDFILDEVIVMNTPMKNHIEALMKSSIAQMKSPLLLTAYYREFINMNKKYIKFSDALIDFHLSKGKSSITSDMVVTQSRAVSFPESEEEAAVRIVPADVREAVNMACNFDVIDRIFDGNKNYKHYEFLVKSQKTKSGEVTETIFFSPKPNVEKALYEGIIVYDPAKKRILNIEATMAAPLRKFARIRNFIFARGRLESYTYQQAFKVVDGHYMLSHSALFGNMHIWTDNGSVNNVYRVKSDMIVTNFTPDPSNFTMKKSSATNRFMRQGLTTKINSGLPIILYSLRLKKRRL